MTPHPYLYEKLMAEHRSQIQDDTLKYLPVILFPPIMHFNNRNR